MEQVLRAAAIYLILMLLFAIAGKRALAEMDTFDFILLLIISEATQQALLTEDFSVTGALVVITTLIGMEIAMGILRRRFPILEKATSGTPVIIVQDGKCLERRMEKEQVSLEDILLAARHHHGLERLEQIKFAILETSGGISIVPRER